MLSSVLHSPLMSSTSIAARCLHTSLRRQGYIVLVPEIGEDAHATDGMLKSDGLPAFNDITIENCLGAIGHQASALEQTVKRIENAIAEQEGKVDTTRIFRELDAVTGPLETTWGIAKALYLGNSTLMPTKSYMNIHERARNARASKFSCSPLFEVLQRKQEQHQQQTAHQATAAGTEERLWRKYLLEGRLNGLTLETRPADKEALRDVLNNLGKERANYKNKVNIAVHSFGHTINDFRLVRDFPANLLAATARDPVQPNQGPWKITLQPQIVEAFMQYCPDRTQRWNVWQADVRKASGQLERSLENSTHVEKIRALRQQQARLLGYPTFADMSMETKMVGSVDNLKKIFAQLLQHAGPAQSVELAALQSFANESGSGQDAEKLEACDVPYWSRKSLLTQHGLDEEQMREYFPLPHVLDGVREYAEKLFRLRIVERPQTEVWQPAVKFYEVYDCDESSDLTDRPVGGIYIDCYSKENRFGRNNGWMVSIRNRNEAAGLTPLCALVFNFAEPVYGRPTLLSASDLRLVFRTFGTALQHVLTRAAYTDLAGLSNIEWDASQVAGHVLANLLERPENLQRISRHYGNDEPLPNVLAQNWHHLHTHLAGYKLCQELYMADLDLELHRSSQFWLDVVRRLWPVYRVLSLDKRDAHPCSMTDVFAGDWAAAHFSHLYSRLIAADVTDAFRASTLSSSSSSTDDTGLRFKQTFLASGGSLPTAEVFRRFRGRDPSVEALLKSLRLIASDTGEKDDSSGKPRTTRTTPRGASGDTV